MFEMLRRRKKVTLASCRLLLLASLPAAQACESSQQDADRTTGTDAGVTNVSAAL